MKPYAEMMREELLELKRELEGKYEDMQTPALELDMSRGKPRTAQLNLSMGMMAVLNEDTELRSGDGTDCRNYGVLTGIPEALELMGDMMEVPYNHIILYGNSSLNVMYDTISRPYTHGVMGSTPWCKLDKVKFLCVVPDYDRHLAIAEYLGIENIPVSMLPTGPDMNIAEELVAEDEAIKDIWCVPKYSDPTGNSYSGETMRRMARLKPAAEDFRIYWDNTYTIHHLYDHDQDTIIKILAERKRAGNPDLVYKFASTSKVSFPGSGIAALASSLNNLEDIKKQLKAQTIGHGKVNQLRHVCSLEDIHGMVEHVRKHAGILRSKFEMIEEILDRELDGLGIGTWAKPKDGYFISFGILESCAKRVVSHCAKAGVIMASAGATWPDGKDPHDSNIRIAPSFPPLNDSHIVAEFFTLCVKYVSIEKLFANMDAAEEKAAEKAEA